MQNIITLMLGITVLLSGNAQSEVDTKWKASQERAQVILDKMTFDEKVAFIAGGKKVTGFCATVPIKSSGVPAFLMADAGSGIRIAKAFSEFAYPADNVSEGDRATSFPGNLAMMASFNPDVSTAVAAAIAVEARAKGIHVLLGPAADLVRSPTYGRNYEYAGEDPYLTSVLVSAYIQSLQQKGVLATAKHFIGNHVEFLRKESNSKISARALRELHFRPYETAFSDAGVMAVMTSYNYVNGERAGESRELCTDILHNELGFRGLVMSDWNSVFDYTAFLVSGIDLIMPSFEKNIQDGLNDGSISFQAYEKDVNRMVLNILTTFIYMDFLDRPQKTAEPVDWTQHEKISLDAAREAIVLLKNEGNILPVKRASVKKNILLTGPLAIKTPALGIGSGHVCGFNRIDIRDALVSIYGQDKISYVANPTDEQLKGADYVIVAAGFLEATEGENRSRTFELPVGQDALILRCAEANPNTIVTLTAGSSVRITPWQNKVKGIFHTLYLGQKCGQAIAEAIAGEINPSGKLPFTMERELADSYDARSFPEWVVSPENNSYLVITESIMNEYNRYLAGDVSFSGFEAFYKTETLVANNKWGRTKLKELNITQYDVNYIEDIYLGYKYYDKNRIPVMYPFGHGLSYTTFEYSDMIANRTGEEMFVELTLKNAGGAAGAEVVQVYAFNPASSFEQPVKELCGFKKVFLNPGETQRVRIPVDKKTLMFWNPESKAWELEKGEFLLKVGGSSGALSLQTIIQ